MTPKEHLKIMKFKEWIDNLESEEDKKEAVRIIQKGIY